LSAKFPFRFEINLPARRQVFLWSRARAGGVPLNARYDEQNVPSGALQRVAMF
jgi:hypothetical protein